MNDIIPEDILKTLEERFGSRFVRRNDGKATPDAHDTVASVFPQSAEEVESLTRLAARHSIPLVARGAGTALYPGKPPRGLTVRFDAMRQRRLPSRRSPSPKGGSARLGAEVLPGEPPGTNPETGPGVGSR
jgi:FAD/FMN-containing dehydrogenase